MSDLTKPPHVPSCVSTGEGVTVPTATATPRTDAEEFFLPPEAANCIEPPQNDGVVESKYARTLERELSSAQAALAEAKADALNTRATLEDYAKREGDLRLANVVLQAKLGGVNAERDQLRARVADLSERLSKYENTN